MSKNIVVCLDGTGNEIGIKMSNVLKLYRILERSEKQAVYYDPGVGTLGQEKTWGRSIQRFKGFIGLAFGYGLDDDVIAAYHFIAMNYEQGDRIFLFGFSRGAYCVRVVAGLINVFGLVQRHQFNLIGYIYSAYKRIATHGYGLNDARNFQRAVKVRNVPIKFVGVWDTVASVYIPAVFIVPREQVSLPIYSYKSIRGKFSTAPLLLMSFAGSFAT